MSQLPLFGQVTPIMNKPEPDEVAAALEDLGTTLESTSTYEESVIKSKTLSTAPILTGLSLPDLSNLCDSKTNISTSTLLSMLRRIRSTIGNMINNTETSSSSSSSSGVTTNSKEYNMLVMKEQILISYLTTIKKMSEAEILGLGKRDIIMEERGRSACLQTNNKRKSQSININNTNEPINSSKKIKRRNGNSNNNTDSKLQKSERLNQIKTSNFGSQTLKERQNDIENSCKKWRRKLFFEDDKKNKMSESFSSSSEASSLIVNIKMLRKERVARRDKFRMVRQKLKGSIDNDDGDHNYLDDKQKMNDNNINARNNRQINDDDDEEEVWREEKVKEVEAEEKIEKMNGRKKSIKKKYVVKNQTSSSSKVRSLRSRNNINLPVKIIADNSASIDDTEKYKNRKWSSRNSDTINYCENLDDDEEDTVTNNTKETPATDDDDDIFIEDAAMNALESEENEEELEIDKYDDDDGDDRLELDTLKASKYKEATDLDDFEEWGYDYRVEEWIDTGISSMRSMSHLQSDELPGSTVFSGGLIVPRWIHNRLFSYQRTGVRWMWELHRQHAGGIVGKFNEKLCK